MGEFNPANNNVYQELNGVFPAAILSAPAYFNDTIYYSPAGSPLLAFGISDAQVSSSPTSQTAKPLASPGATPSISANGTNNAIVWAVEKGSPAALLHAYDATNLSTELYNSSQAPNQRDNFGPGSAGPTVTVANGAVFVGTANGVAVFGEIPPSPASTAPTITTQPASQTVQVGQPATFTVVVAGSSPLSYQWQRNGVNIPGAILPNYTTPPTSSADDGSAFDVVVTNVFGSANSSSASLGVNAPQPNR